jgi:hypothetical protein
MLVNCLLGIFKCLLNSFNLAVTIHVQCFILQHTKQLPLAVHSLPNYTRSHFRKQ